MTLSRMFATFVIKYVKTKPLLYMPRGYYDSTPQSKKSTLALKVSILSSVKNETLHSNIENNA